MFTLETIAVVFALVYLLLVIRQNIWCWPAGIVSTAIYVYVFYDAKLYMEAGLQFFYIAMAIYGWLHWRSNKEQPALKISRFTTRQHLITIGAIVLLALTSGQLLSHFSDAALPFIDSLTTWGGIVATWMVARKIFENWHYWFVIDSISIYLYLNRDLKQTAALFTLYLILIVVGYLSWRNQLPGTNSNSASTSGDTA